MRKADPAQAMLEREPAAFPIEGTWPYFSEPECFNQRLVAIDVFFLEVAQERLSLADHDQKATLTVMVFVVYLHVAGKAVDALSKKRNLNFRGSGVVLTACKLAYDVRLFLCCQRHVQLLL